MRIQYMSDLHLEFFENWLYVDEEKIPVTGDVLVIAGDTCYIREAAKSRKDFWEWASKHYRQTLIVPGNHEFYDNSDVTERSDSWQCEMCENVSYYYNKVVRLDDVDFVLTTL